MRRAVLLAGICLGLGLPTVLEAAVEAPLAVRQEYRTLYPELKKSDLWTTLLWEDWARRQGQRLGSPLPALVLGSTAFATPEDVRFIKDRGDTVEVLTNHRWYQFANDGHPIAVPLVINAGRRVNERSNGGWQAPLADAAFSFSPGFVAVLDYTYADDDKFTGWHTRVTKTADGSPAYESISTEPAGENPPDWAPMAVANDGTAVALGLSIGPVGVKTMVVVSSETNNRAVSEDLRRPLGVGSKGAWLIADTLKGGEWLPVLVVGDKRELMRAAAVGPGIAAALKTDNTVVLVHENGSITNLPLPISIGDNPRMATVGRFLVICSGVNAVSLDNTDFFGVPLASPPAQPQVTMFIPWDELASGVHSASGTVTGTMFPGMYEVDYNAVASVYVWNGQQTTLVDLSGAQLQSHLLYQASGRVTWVESRSYWNMVSFVEASTAIVNDAGQELWSGQGYPNPVSAEYAVLTVGEDHPDYSLITLDPDPKKRTTVHLELEGKDWGYDLDPFGQVLLCHRGEDWITFDLKGLPLARGGRHSAWPTILTPQFTPGRFCFMAGRIFPKSQPPPNAESRLCPNDAYMLPDDRHMVVLMVDRAEHVLAYIRDRKPDPWQDLGRCPQARRFGIDRGDNVVVINDNSTEVATLSNGEFKSVDNGPSASILPPGSWQVDPNNNTFVPPGSPAFHWSEVNTGFLPKRMHSGRGEEGMLVVVTASLVLVLNNEQSILDLMSELAH